MECKWLPAEISKGQIEPNGTRTTKVAANYQVLGGLAKAYGCFGGVPDVRSGTVRLASPHAGHWAPIHALHMIGNPGPGMSDSLGHDWTLEIAVMTF